MSHPRDASAHAVPVTTIAPLHRRSFANHNRDILPFGEKEYKGAETRSHRHQFPMPNDAVRSPSNPIFTNLYSYRTRCSNLRRSRPGDILLSTPSHWTAEASD
jgi:hypothetical protein